MINQSHYQWLIIVFVLFIGEAQAVCTYFPNNTHKFEVAFVRPLEIGTVAMTAARDKPVGQVIYTQRISFTGYNFGFYCSSAYSGRQVTEYEFTPLPLSALNTGSFANKAYQTSVPGVGVAVRNRTSGLPYFTSSFGGGAGGGAISDTYFEVFLVKTGPITPGVLDAATLPVTVLYNELTETVSGIEYKFPQLRLSFTGTITVQAQTCTTPDVQVNMGTHPQAEFTGIDSSPGWVDFSILLVNCPAFYGSTYSANSGDPIGASAPPQYEPTTSTTTANAINFMITPNTAATPSTGTFALDSASTARGIKVQLGKNNGTPLVLNAYTPSGITPTQNQGDSYSIPLKARYIQSGTAVTPGTANASVQFTIQYL